MESLKNNRRTVGMNQSLKAVESGTARTVYIAKDAEEKVVKVLKELCRKNSVEIIYIENMKQLGKACGIEVGAAAACLLKEDEHIGKGGV